MRIFKTIKWLLNHPPIGITEKMPEGSKCDYCGSDDCLYKWLDFCTCKECFRKVFDKNLKKRKPKNK